LAGSLHSTWAARRTPLWTPLGLGENSSFWRHSLLMQPALPRNRLFCVSTVSIVWQAPVPPRTGDGLDPRYFHCRDAADVLTVLTLSSNRLSPTAVILIVRVPNRPSRPKTISIPTVRRKVCARRSRPASARGLFGQLARLVPACKRSDALPVHCAWSAMSSRTWAATGSAPTMFSIASRRLCE
jgi:hypothetical protein